MSGILLRAAVLMRERAEAESDRTISDPRVSGVWLNSAHYLTVTPAVALAVADWLEFEHANGSTYNAMTERSQRAFAVARAYLGDAS